MTQTNDAMTAGDHSDLKEFSAGVAENYAAAEKPLTLKGALRQETSEGNQTIIL